jgi:hypothetical protein
VRPRQADAAGLSVRRSKISRWISGRRVENVTTVLARRSVSAEEVGGGCIEDDEED